MNIPLSTFQSAHLLAQADSLEAHIATKKNVYLIDLGTGTDRSLLPLGCGLIAAYCLSKPPIKSAYDIEVLMLAAGLPDLIAEMDAPYVIGLACYMWNFFGCVEVSRLIRQKYPEAIIVWGGPNVPSKNHRIEEFVRKYRDNVDILVHGEGEETFSDLLIHQLLDEPSSPQ